jgi:hypothetical protein
VRGFSGLFTGDITLIGNLVGRTDVSPRAHRLPVAHRGWPAWWQRRTTVVLLAAVKDAAVSAFANPIFVNPGASAVT